MTQITHDPEEVVMNVQWLEIRCEECPQSRVDMGRCAGDRGLTARP